MHDAGLLHRDIKAHNVMLDDDGRVVLMDFGTGRELGDGGPDMAGTPLYLAPEVFRGQPATVQSDIYSLGVLLYRLLTGSYPVQAATVDDLRRAHEANTRPDLSLVRGSTRFAQIVARALEPSPDEPLSISARDLSRSGPDDPRDGAKPVAAARHRGSSRRRGGRLGSLVGGMAAGGAPSGSDRLDGRRARFLHARRAAGWPASCHRRRTAAKHDR